MLKVPTRKQRVSIFPQSPSKTAELFSSSSVTKNTEYRLSVFRIFELLCDRRNTVLYTNKLTGETFRLKSARNAAAAMGISNTVIHNLLDSHKEGRWVELSQNTLVRLAALLQSIEPGLIDPLDPEEKEIRFCDRFDGNTIIRGWQQLARLHQESAPTPQEILFSDAMLEGEGSADTLPGVSASLKKSIKSLILRYIENPDRGNLVIPKLDQFYSCSKLAELIQEQRGDRTLVEYANWLVSLDLAEIKKESDRKALKEEYLAPVLSGLQMILTGAFPSGESYGKTMRILAKHLVPEAEGNVTELLRMCQEVQEEG